MITPFLSGMLSAWTAAQIGLGAFFVLAFWVSSREAEYLLFGLLCGAMAVTTGALAAAYGMADPGHRMMALQLSHAGVIAGAALNLDFVIRYARMRQPVLMVAIYSVAAVELLALNMRWWWRPQGLELIGSEILGSHVVHATLLPARAALVGYLVPVIELLVSPVLLLFAYRRGRREALGAFVGASVLCLAIGNDAALVARIVPDTLYLLPHAFLGYAFAMARTLLLRYRRTAVELEQTIGRLRLRTEELRRSDADLKLIQTELVKKQQLAAVGELAAAIAHEVRNPLAVIVNAVAGLRRPGGSKEDRAILLGIVDEETARLNRLVTDLLRFARPVKIKRSAVSLVELARRSQAACRESHQIDVSVPTDPDLRTIWVDPGLFRVVFDNLVDNACHAMPGGGRINIVAGRNQLRGAPALRIQIRDSGRGMTAEVLERAGDPFFTTRPSGTGLGLPIVQRILDAHGGALVLESDPGLGTTVNLLLPLGNPEQMAQGAVPRSA